MNVAPYAGPLLITALYLLGYYITMLHILRTKLRLINEYKARGEKFDRYFSNDREMLAADRIQLNMLEHMPPFLALLWLNAVFVSVTFATVFGGIYLVSRLIYPLMLGSRLGKSVKDSILVSTLPGYIVIVGFAVALIVVAIQSLAQ